MKFAAGVLAGGVMHDLTVARNLCHGWQPYYAEHRVIYIMRRGQDVKAAFAPSPEALIEQIEWAEANPEYDPRSKL